MNYPFHILYTTVDYLGISRVFGREASARGGTVQQKPKNGK